MIARLLRWLFPGPSGCAWPMCHCDPYLECRGQPDWTQDDLASAWRKKTREHVCREPAHLTIAEDAAWRADARRRRSAFSWGE